MTIQDLEHLQSEDKTHSSNQNVQIEESKQDTTPYYSFW